MSRAADRFLAVMKAAFFDVEAVWRKVELHKRKGLDRFGAFVRRRAQTSMRPRVGPSKPGDPPHAHQSKRLRALKRKWGKRVKYTGALLREMLLFAYDPVRRSMVVGPVPFGKGVPELHEYGGTRKGDGRVMEVRNSPGRDAGGRFVTAGVRLVKLDGTLRYPARPYMRPALAHTAPQFPRHLVFNAGSTLGSPSLGI